VIVVACVLLAAVVAPNVAARRVAGSPVAAPIDEPPAPGTCVTAMADPWAADPAPGFAVGKVIDFPTARFGPCAGTVIGEVAVVDSDTFPAKRIVDSDYQGAVQQCALDSIGYLGSIAPVVERAAGQQGIVWTPDLTFRYTPVGPTALQRAAGQRWSACVVGSAGVTPYLGRLHKVLDTGVLPPDFGSCWPSMRLRDAQQVPCDSPHVLEVLGSTNLGPAPVSGADVRDACAVYAGRALRTSDPTRQGALRLDILDFDMGASVSPAADADLRRSFVSCVVTAAGGRSFNGTLVGIGQRPLPLV